MRYARKIVLFGLCLGHDQKPNNHKAAPHTAASSATVCCQNMVPRGTTQSDHIRFSKPEVRVEIPILSEGANKVS